MELAPTLRGFTIAYLECPVAKAIQINSARNFGRGGLSPDSKVFGGSSG